jgi:F-type H+-transporting ATPase subunit b
MNMNVNVNVNMKRVAPAAALLSLLCSLLAASPALASGGEGESTLLNQSIDTLVFLTIIVLLALKPAKAAVAARSDEVAKEINAAKAAHEQARALLSKYESMIGSLESERAALLEQYRAQGEAEKAALIDEGKRDAERLAADAKRAAENELLALQRKIEVELVNAALAKAEALLKTGVGALDHDRLTQEYIKQVEQLGA